MKMSIIKKAVTSKKFYAALICMILCFAIGFTLVPARISQAEEADGTEKYESITINAEDYEKYLLDGVVEEGADDTSDIDMKLELSGHPKLLYDNAGLLSDANQVRILNRLNEVSERQQFAIVIITVPSLPEGYTPEAYADDLYDYMGYGYGSGHDGTLLLVTMKERKWHVSTTGFGIRAITDKGLDYMSDRFVPAMSDGDYYESFDTFITLCDEFVTEAREGKPYDVGHMPKGSFDFFRAILIALGIGLAVGLIVALVMKGKLRSVRANGSAASYLKPGSMNVTESRDRFLYMNVTKTEKPKSSSGGSSTHSSSSGTSHGGGGGSF